MSCSDEIDLELIAKTYQLPLWQMKNKVEKLGKLFLPCVLLLLTLQTGIPRDTTDKAGPAYQKRQDWVYTGSAVPYDKVHEYVVNWDTDKISWYMDQELIVDFNKASGGQLWPQQPLHVRYGLWGVTQSDWAEGSVNWQKFPEPQQQMTQITVTGCMKV